MASKPDATPPVSPPVGRLCWCGEKPTFEPAMFPPPNWLAKLPPKTRLKPELQRFLLLIEYLSLEFEEKEIIVTSEKLVAPAEMPALCRATG